MSPMISARALVEIVFSTGNWRLTVLRCWRLLLAGRVQRDLHDSSAVPLSRSSTKLRRRIYSVLFGHRKAYRFKSGIHDQYLVNGPRSFESFSTHSR